MPPKLNTDKNPSNSKPPLTSSKTRSGKTDVNMVSVSGQITSPSRSSNFPASNLQTPSKIYDAMTQPSKPHDSQAFDSITEHPLYAQVQAVDKSLRAFFEHDWETNQSYKLTRLQYFKILLHFDPETKARPHHPKPTLIDNFKTNLLPRIRPFCSLPPPPGPPPMDTEDNDEDFDPLDPKTTIPMLLRAIAAKNPNVQTSTVALKAEVLSMYKHYVNPQLKLPVHNFSKTPKIVKSNSVDRLTIKQIQHAIHCYNPELFLNDPVLRLSHYRMIYRAYILEEQKNPDDEDLVEGYHFWTNKGLVQTQ